MHASASIRYCVMWMQRSRGGMRIVNAFDVEDLRNRCLCPIVKVPTDALSG